MSKEMKKHLKYKASHIVVGKHEIYNFKPNNEDKGNKLSIKDYRFVKENFRSNLAHFKGNFSLVEKEREKIVKKDAVTKEDLELYSEFYYLEIETFTRFPSFLIDKIKKDFKSIEFKVFKNFNRKAVLKILASDLKLFITIVEEIANYDGKNFNPAHVEYKRVKSFHYYDVKERIKYGKKDVENSELMIRLFQVDSNRKEKIEAFISNFFDVKDLGNLFYLIKPKEKTNFQKSLYLVGHVVSDLEEIVPSLSDIILSPTLGGKLKSDYTINNEIDINKLVSVGVIDSGICKERTPLMKVNSSSLNRSLIKDDDSLNDATNHGTGVAGLVAFGTQLENGLNVLNPEAKVVSIKLFSSSKGCISMTDIPDLIDYYYTRGVKIFNLSFNLYGPKKDNERISEMAFFIDNILAQSKYSNVLLFISSGNIDNHINLQAEYGESSNYFFDWRSNINSPADSTNSISVGSVNKDGVLSYFSRKNSLDYAEPLSVKDKKITLRIGSCCKYFHKKPDIVLIGENIKTFSSEILNEVKTKISGTSFSSPLACNIATNILNKYPNLKANSVKALILNSSCDDNLKINNLQNSDFLPLKLKERINGKKELLDTEIKSLEKRCFGFGLPDKERAMNSNSSRATIVLEEEEIELNSKKIYQLKMPYKEFLGKGLIRLTSSLCYNHIPIYSDHLNYNPINISFRIISCKNNDKYVELLSDLEIISEKLSRIEVNFALEVSENNKKIKAEKRKLKKIYKNKENRINSLIIEIQNWTQDNYYNKMYGNIQLFKKNFIKNSFSEKLKSGMIYLEVRCNIKSKDEAGIIFQEIKNFFISKREKEDRKIIDNFQDLKKYYKPGFSIAVTLEDISKEKNYNLYNKIFELNPDILATVETSADAEVEV